MKKSTVGAMIILAIISGLVIGGGTVKVGEAQTEACMYPMRPLVEGRCDNSDPCDPTTIKDEQLHGDCAPEEPIVAPIVDKPEEPKPVPGCSSGN